MRFRPAATRSSIRVTFCSVEMGVGSRCNPSRGPTSMMVASAGKKSVEDTGNSVDAKRCFPKSVAFLNGYSPPCLADELTLGTYRRANCYGPPKAAKLKKKLSKGLL